MLTHGGVGGNGVHGMLMGVGVCVPLVVHLGIVLLVVLFGMLVLVVWLLVLVVGSWSLSFDSWSLSLGSSSSSDLACLGSSPCFSRSSFCSLAFTLCVLSSSLIVLLGGCLLSLVSLTWGLAAWRCRVAVVGMGVALSVGVGWPGVGLVHQRERHGGATLMLLSANRGLALKRK